MKSDCDFTWLFEYLDERFSRPILFQSLVIPFFLYPIIVGGAFAVEIPSRAAVSPKPEYEISDRSAT